MRRDITEPVLNDRGDEEHPSFGVVRLSRVTSHPAARLFDSSVGHSEYVKLEIARAVRKRDLHNDRVFGDPTPLIEVSMSLSQWGAMVSSFNQGSGTPVTLNRVGRDVMPEAAHESRLAVTAREVKDAAMQSTADVAAAVQAVDDAFEDRAGRREMGEAIRGLVATVGNLPSNMRFAADTLTRHAEDVVSKARADIEAAHQFGAHPAIGTPDPLELTPS